MPNSQETTFSPRSVLKRVEGAVTAAIGAGDPQQRLSNSDFDAIADELVDKVYRVLEDEQRLELNDEDFGFIQERARKMTRERLPQPPAAARRFGKLDRVVCYIGGERGWAAGSVQAVNEEDPSDPTGQTLLPYVVKIDPPNPRLVSVPRDAPTLVRAEVCFGQRPGAPQFTRKCLPAQPGRRRAAPRFAAGDRVACAVEDATDLYSDWAAGTVRMADHALAEGGATVPYEVQLDSGVAVLVHRDEHWLVRELALQPPGPRVAADGARSLAKFAKRKVGDGWEVVDHATRKVRRVLEADEDDEDDEDD